MHIKLAVSLSLTGLVMTGCGGSGGDSNPTPVDPVVAETSTADLKKSVTANLGRSLTRSVDEAQQIDSPSASAPLTPGPDDSRFTLFDSTLALDDDAGVRTTRAGNIITIDPDETLVCSGDDDGAIVDQAEYDDCVTLMRDVTARIVATDDDTGELTYLYKSQPLLSIGYAPESDSFEINFGTMKMVADTLVTLDSVDPVTLPDTMTGAMKLSASRTIDAAGSETGTIKHEVTQPINFVDADGGVNLSMGVGTPFSMSVNADTGNGSVEFDVGAINASGPFEDTRVANFSMPGFTGKADVQGNGEKLIVSNLGLYRGPMSFSVDSMEALRLSMETFGFTATEADGGVAIDGNMDISVFVDETIGAEPGAMDALITSLNITAPSGTSLIERLSGQTEVIAGGPLNISSSVTGDGIDRQLSISVAAGQCLSEDQDGDPVLVVCE